MGFNNGDNKLAELVNSGSNGDFDSLHQHIHSIKFREHENVFGVCSGTFKDFPLCAVLTISCFSLRFSHSSCLCVYLSTIPTNARCRSRIEALGTAWASRWSPQAQGTPCQV